MQQRGATLIEIVLAVVVVTIAVGAVLGVLSANAKQSADIMIREQAIAIGNAYLEEILLKPYNDPDGTNGETLRASYDDVSDYNGLNDSTGARNQLGTLINALSQYRIQVAVTAETLSGVAMKRVDVTVSYAASIQSGLGAPAIRLTGYRADYP
jgi:MSHA pilin protein MshD